MDEFKKKCRRLLTLWLILVPLYSLVLSLCNAYLSIKAGTITNGVAPISPGLRMFNFWGLLLIILPLTWKLYKSAVAAQMPKTKAFSVLMLVVITLCLILFILFYIASLFLPDLF